MKLYELSEQYAEAFEHLTEMEDEIGHDAVKDTLEALEGEVKDKALNVGMHVKNLRADAGSLKTAMDEFKSRLDKVNRNISFYEEYLFGHMQRVGIDEAKNGYTLLKFRKLPDTVQIDGDVPHDFCTHKPETWSPDKRKLYKKMKDGEKFGFASLLTDRKKLDIK